MDILLQKTVNFEMKDFPSESRISPMYFKKHEDPNFVNTRLYIPPELQVNVVSLVFQTMYPYSSIFKVPS